MARVTMVPYAGLADRDALASFLTECLIRDPDAGYLHPGDVFWRMWMFPSDRISQRIAIWRDDAGQIVGFAWFTPPADVEWQIHPDWRGTGDVGNPDGTAIEDDILRWSSDVTRQEHALAVARGDDKPLPETLGISYYSGDTKTIAYLESRGAQLASRPDEDMFGYSWPLVDATFPEAPLADGFTLRDVRDIADWDDRVAIHCDVWAPSRFSADAYEMVRESPIYRPDRDLVAVAPDGAFASYALVWYDPVSRIGEFEPVGTREAYRGRGLGRAVLIEGLRRLQELGAREAIVYTYVNTPPAVALYRSAGFTIVGKYHFATLPISPPA